MITVEITIYETQNVYRKQLHKETHKFPKSSKIAVARGFKIGAKKVKTINLRNENDN